MNELADLLTQKEGVEETVASARGPDPLDAATLIVIDRSGPQLRVLMGRRHEKHVFLPGRYVFPGGRVDREDAQVAALGELDPASARRLHARAEGIDAAGVRALALASVRETLEETGLMVGKPHNAPFNPPAPVWAPFAAASIHPDLSALTFAVRAITPPGRPRRFDTRFFLAERDAIAGQAADVVGPDAELVELKWLTIAETQPEHLSTITRVVLAEIEARLKDGDRPVPFYYWKDGRFWRDELN